MTPENTSQQLLFGILAFQNGFVEHGQFMNAMRQWLKDKNQPLDQILLSAGALSSDDHALLLPMVNRHIQDHDGDATISVAQVSAYDSVREQLENLEDADLDQALETIAQSIAEAEADIDATIASDLGSSVSRLGSRFRVLRPHKAGGLGYVSIAEDEEIRRLDGGGERGREVALKRIRKKYADDPSFRRRFRVEAEITGGLEHPHVVPVYGLGQDETGRPFYAMRLIRGSNLKEAVAKYYVDAEDPIRELDEGRMSVGNASARKRYRFRRLLEKLIDMCEAMHFAHRRGVLHRDLKPGNVMLGRYGEVMVVDWGLAISKERDPSHVTSEDDDDFEPALVARSADDSTSAKRGVPEGTPQYMAPEQATGDVDKLGPRTDVYSLGATLYFILTGSPPFGRDDLSTTLSKVQLGDFPKPRALSDDVPKPLEAICMKAMATKISNRYVSAAELAIDLQRWLDGEPVSAWREPFYIRVRRWIRNHQRLVTGLATAAAVALVSLIVISFIVNKWRELEKAAKEDAQRNYAVASQAVDSFYTKVAEEGLLGQPGMESARTALLNDAKTAYEALATSLAATSAGNEDAARATYRLGYLLNELQDTDKAKEHLQSAYQEQQKFFANQPNDAHRFDLSNTINALGQIELFEKNYDAAENDFLKALEHRLVLAGMNRSMDDVAKLSDTDFGKYIAELLAAQTTNSRDLRKLANTYMNLGVVARKKAEANASRAKEYADLLTRSELFFDRSLAIRAAVPGVDDYVWNRDYVQSLINRLQVLYLGRQVSPKAGTGQSTEVDSAIPLHQKASGLLDRMRHKPDNTEIERLSLNEKDIFARRRKGSVSPEQSVKDFASIAVQAQVLSDLSPDEPRHKQNVARYWIEVGNLQFTKLDDLDAARDSYQSAIGAIDDLPVSRDLAYAGKVLAKIEERQNKLEAAEARLKTVIKQFEELGDSSAELPDTRPILTKVQAKLALQRDERDEALRLAERAVAEWAAQTQSHPNSADARWQLEDAQTLLKQLQTNAS